MNRNIKVWCMLGTLALFFNGYAIDRIVTTTADGDPAPAGSLREAIQLAMPGDRILFDIAPTGGVKTIELVANLPEVFRDNITIDGYSAGALTPHNTATPNTATDGTTNAILEIQLSGNNYALSNGLSLTGDNCVVRGLIINEFNDTGIFVTGDRNTIAGNFIGTDSEGTTVMRNQLGVLVFPGDNNTIGGLAPEDTNIIAGSYNFFNFGAAVALLAANGNEVQRNLIGLDRTGRIGLGESTANIYIVSSFGNTIGGDTLAARNIIAGTTNGMFGILLSTFADGNTIQNNYIGTDVTGTESLSTGIGICIRRNSGNTIVDNLISGNDFDGINVGMSNVTLFTQDSTVRNNIIGLDASGKMALPNGRNGIAIQGFTQNMRIEENTVSGNAENGIYLSGFSSQSQIVGNFIGTDSQGVVAIGNEGNGIQLGAMQNPTSANTIGGSLVSERNVISGNKKNGIALIIESSSNEIRNNYIGTSLTGLEFQRPDCQQYGNSENGIYIFRSSNNLLEDNIITRNGKAGVAIESCTGQDTVDNAIVSNQIFNNCGLGIDLGRDGITPNDVQDSDLGANRLQNFPVFTSVRRCGSATRVTGVLNSIPSTSFLIQFFSNDVNREGITEGKELIDEMTVKTDRNGNAKFERAFSSNLTSGYFISATATRLEGEARIETSEFAKGGLSKSCLTSCLINKVCKFKEDCVIDCN